MKGLYSQIFILRNQRLLKTTRSLGSQCSELCIYGTVCSPCLYFVNFVTTLLGLTPTTAVEDPQCQSDRNVTECLAL